MPPGLITLLAKSTGRAVCGKTACTVPRGRGWKRTGRLDPAPRQSLTRQDFHMGLKTGCALEQRQLETGHGLRNFLAFASVVAWHLLRLRQAARAKEPVPIEQVLSPT